MAKKKTIIEGSVLYYLDKEGHYKAMSLSNLISASIDPDGYVAICFSKSSPERSDGCSWNYFRGDNEELLRLLNEVLRKKRIKKTFDRLVASEPFSSVENLMAKAEAIEALLEEKKMENF